MSQIHNSHQVEYKNNKNNNQSIICYQFKLKIIRVLNDV